MIRGNKLRKSLKTSTNENYLQEKLNDTLFWELIWLLESLAPSGYNLVPQARREFPLRLFMRVSGIAPENWVKNHCREEPSHWENFKTTWDLPLDKQTVWSGISQDLARKHPILLCNLPLLAVEHHCHVSVEGTAGNPKLPQEPPKQFLSTGKLVGCRYLAVLNAIHHGDNKGCHEPQVVLHWPSGGLLVNVFLEPQKHPRTPWNFSGLIEKQRGTNNLQNTWRYGDELSERQAPEYLLTS